MTDPKHAHETENGRLERRFLGFTPERPEDGCWHWSGKRSRDGYGRFSIATKWALAHRVAYQMFIGPIAEGSEIDHLCHNADATCAGGTECPHRICVNPAHLEAVTHKTNMHRTKYIGAKVRQTHCKHGHEYTEANTGRDSRGNRRCRACDRAAKAARQAARKAVRA